MNRPDAHIERIKELGYPESEARFLYIAERQAYFCKAKAQFRSPVKRPLESDVSRELLRYFQIRKKWENHEYVIPVTADLEFLKEARCRFHGDRFETLYRAWCFGELGDGELQAEFSQLGPDRAVFFDTYLVHRHGSPLAVASGQGERCMKDTDHPPVHHRVHHEISRSSSEHEGCA